MDRQKIHDQIIARARSRFRSKKEGYFELHHIVPRAVGGEENPENEVLLSLREHFLIHVLLWKLHPGDRRYRDPIFWFTHKGVTTSRLYEAARKEHIDEMRNANPSLFLSDETRARKKAKLSAYAANRPVEHNRKLSESKKGKQLRLGAVLSDQTKNQISQSVRRWYDTHEVTMETREKLARAWRGRNHSPSSIEKQKHAALKRIKRECPNCGKWLDPGNYTQHVRNGW